VERQLEVKKGERLRENCGATIGCTAGRMAERDLRSDIWLYSTARG